MFRAPPAGPRKEDEDEGAVNPGSNLFVTGIHPRLTESDVSRLFEKYGDVENCSIMVDPHTKESRGFGFVKMVTAEQADAAKEGLQGEVIEGRTLSIEKARRSRPRTPTPGKYFGPPKRGKLTDLCYIVDHALISPDFRGPPRRGGDRYDDRRGGYGGYRRSDDRYSRYDSYSDRSRDYDRGYGRRDYRDYRDEYGYRGIDRYSGRGGGNGGGEERYNREERREERRGGEERRGYYDRDANPPSYDAAPARESRDAYSSRSYEGRGGEDRYSGR